MKHIALIESPFHLICLSEAIDEFTISALDIVVVTSHSSRNFAQLEAVKSFYKNLNAAGVKWYFGDTDTASDTDLNERIGVYARVYNELKHNDYRRLFISDFRSQWQKDIAATSNAPEKWLLDDGTATLAFCYYHLPKGRLFSLPVYGSGARLREAQKIKEDYGLSLRDVTKLNMFTVFDKHVPQQILTRHNTLRSLQKSFDSLATDTTLIIGAKILERDFCSVRDYHAFIETIIAEATSEVVYVPHRGQSQHFNDALADAFPQLEILYIDSPLEIWFYQQASPPAHVCGFVSTFFYVAAQVFEQVKLTCYAPTNDVLSQADKAGVYGSDLFTNSEAIRINFQCLPEAVERRYIEAEVCESD
ncbi:polysialyltransferase family glycosyltransferase [Alteromonas sp. H39]|uniref:polysialyltransferase family glycosyltransferase n=1 Tax=Alteromonas sp. H39 TaxID=3389876 RepID=UPI0039DF67C6